MVNSRSFLSISLLASTALGSNIFRREAQAEATQCQCGQQAVETVLAGYETEVIKTVRYLVVDMPEQQAAQEESEAEEALPEDVLRGGATAALNSTTTLPPCAAPDVDVSDKKNIIPAPQISIFYGGAGDAAAPPQPPAGSGGAPFSNSTHTNATVPAAPQGSINVTLSTNQSFVALEYIQSIVNVHCSDDLLTVRFADAEAFDVAAQNWESLEAGLVIITNDQGNCNAEFERGFFKVEDVQPNKADLTIACTASAQKIEDIAESCEMTFSSLPAATLRKRITLNPSATITFGASLAEKKTLLDLEPYLKVSADEAAFETSVTFSGKLRYDILGFKLRELYFDLDASFNADVALSAEIQAAYNQTFQYAPDELEYSLISVPGIVSLGPGVAFGIGVDLSASAAVNVTTALGVSLPAGNVHIDLVNKDKGTSATGWDPKYSAAANITEKAVVGADVFASVTVQLAVKVLGGLVDLSSGLTATPRVNNRFALDATQQLKVEGSNSTNAVGTVLQPAAGTLGACDQGLSIKSDFLFNLTGFITKYWSKNLYGVEVPIANKCYKFSK